ncbi:MULTISPECIES: acetyl-CoA C-acyltransferase [unclassified Aeromicrobium]|uniref:acetyl-CoA C-acyltransferase n=1 Tax=unclassified Aeromicrobium TaxID=2633570 RepID=UPI000700DAD7|nr:MULTISPECIES: acetyl-CoA C-acyltransferase [unclassified Aeromicrobium]KQX74420.1 acetyl-CoA acetyltransferase [Aeromicrobium sp. Root472D3]MBD8608653.1 acetyl-CoA C-acyltransferase [Aeromicrobium sp. CFBP 8757]
MTDAYVLDYVRTPRGKASPKGSLHAHSALDLVVHLQDALVERTGLDVETVDDVVLGCASQVDEQGANIARTAALLAGWGDSAPGVTINRFCASGVDAVGQTAARVRADDLQLAVAGGVESVSRVPMFVDRGPLWTDHDVVRQIGSVHMGIAADLNATMDGFTRAELDAYGLETQLKAAQARADGAFGRSLVPVGTLDHDELVRPDTTLEGLAALPPAFAELGAGGQDAIALGAYQGVSSIDHLHTVGTSPAMADAAALLLIGSAAAAERAGLPPRARIVGSATTSVNPVVMLTAGQSAVEQVIARAGLTSADIDVFEFAEAFSALCLRFRRDLDAGPDRMNPNGGTMAMGHAFGATGAILVGSCVDELERRGGRYGVAAVSGAAGLGVAVLVERIAS